MNNNDYSNGFFISKKLLTLFFLLWALIVSGGYIYQQIVINYQIICRAGGFFNFVCQLF